MFFNEQKCSKSNRNSILSVCCHPESSSNKRIGLQRLTAKASINAPGVSLGNLAQLFKSAERVTKSTHHHHPQGSWGRQSFLPASSCEEITFIPHFINYTIFFKVKTKNKETLTCKDRRAEESKGANRKDVNNVPLQSGSLVTLGSPISPQMSSPSWTILTPRLPPGKEENQISHRKCPLPVSQKLQLQNKI